MLVVLMLGGLLMPVAVAGAATTEPVVVQVLSTQRWTPTHISVKTGDSISVNASGIVHAGKSPITHMAPGGFPPDRCTQLTPPNGKTGTFTAPGLACWSLIGMIGTGPPFKVGARANITATSDGELVLGINDNQLSDNSGNWTARISVAAGGSGVGGSSKSSSSNAILFVILALVIVGALVAIFGLRRRRHPDPEPTAAPADVIIPDEPPVAVFAPPIVNHAAEEPARQPAEQTVGSLAKAAPFGTSVAPGEGEVVDVNIFEVEIANGTDLRVGYNYFPEGTELHWQVRQGAVFANGEFATNGGGNIYHYVTVPLGVKLLPAPAAADVQFTWSIGGVPFRYSVRRDPGV